MATSYNAYAGALNNFNQNGIGTIPVTPTYPGYQQYSQYPELPYVTGIEGANAFQMPRGVSKIVLWDTHNDSFYVKMLDEMGRPKVVAWKDYIDHVEPEPEVKQTETSIDTSKFVTKDDLMSILDKALSGLTIGEQGRIVRSNEFHA